MHNKKNLIKIGQENLIRKPGVERWQIEGDEHKDHRVKILALMDEAGFLKEANSTASHYDYVLLLGATEKSMKKRIDYAAEYLQQYVHPTAWQKIKNNLTYLGSLVGMCRQNTAPKLVALVGARPLDAKVESLRFGKTETDAMKGLLKESPLADYPVQIVESPMKTNNQGTLVRPTTDDTIIAWLATSPSPGSSLVVSNQPYVQRQTLAFEALVPQGFSFEGVGPAAGDNAVAVYLDELARTLYQQKKLFEAHPELANKNCRD